MKFKPISVVVFSLLLFFSAVTYGTERNTVPPGDKPEGPRSPAWNDGPDQDTPEVPLIRKMSEGVFLLGDITINKLKGTVTVKGEVNMDEGLVEYFVVGPRGKLHESVFKLHVDPYHIQIALLLIGLEPGNKPLSYQGAPETPKGDPVEIWVTWHTSDKKEVMYRAEDCLYNKKMQKTMEHTHWVFTGSQIIDGRFMAGVEHSIAATYHDPFAILDHPLSTGADDTLYFVNTDVVPPKGTSVSFIIKSLKLEKSQGMSPAAS